MEQFIVAAVLLGTTEGRFDSDPERRAHDRPRRGVSKLRVARLSLRPRRSISVAVPGAPA